MSIKKLNINFFIFIYLSFLSLSFIGVGLKDFVPFLSYFLEGDRRISYLYSESTKYRVGFRADFALFNTFFLFIFLFINKKTRSEERRVGKECRNKKSQCQNKKKEKQDRKY